MFSVDNEQSPKLVAIDNFFLKITNFSSGRCAYTEALFQSITEKINENGGRHQSERLQTSDTIAKFEYYFRGGYLFAIALGFSYNLIVNKKLQCVTFQRGRK